MKDANSELALVQKSRLADVRAVSQLNQATDLGRGVSECYIAFQEHRELSQAWDTCSRCV